MEASFDELATELAGSKVSVCPLSYFEPQSNKLTMRKLYGWFDSFYGENYEIMLLNSRNYI
jgi:hypothetical protein